MTSHLTEFQGDRRLVSIFRDQIDGHSIEGYVLAVSDPLLVLQYVNDFRLDGIKVLRVADISDAESSDTTAFQQTLLIGEGLEREVPFDATFDARNWASILTQFSATYPIMIAECEDSDENSFVIGRVVAVHDDRVEMLGFAGNGSWDEAVVVLNYADLTACQVGSNYLNVYQRYFEGRA